jgi:hypothetical protein
MKVQKSKVVSRNKHFNNNHLFHSKMQRVLMLMTDLELNQKVTYLEDEHSLLYTISALHDIEEVVDDMSCSQINSLQNEYDYVDGLISKETTL